MRILQLVVIGAVIAAGAGLGVARAQQKPGAPTMVVYKSPT
jgi:hypothetical protein